MDGKSSSHPRGRRRSMLPWAELTSCTPAGQSTSNRPRDETTRPRPELQEQPGHAWEGSDLKRPEEGGRLSARVKEPLWDKTRSDERARGRLNKRRDSLSRQRQQAVPSSVHAPPPSPLLPLEVKGC
ncbi:uncharacterized protein LOC144039303 [Vanacampus margaritifer]